MADTADHRWRPRRDECVPSVHRRLCQSLFIVPCCRFSDPIYLSLPVFVIFVSSSPFLSPRFLMFTSPQPPPCLPAPPPPPSLAFARSLHATSCSSQGLLRHGHPGQRRAPLRGEAPLRTAHRPPQFPAPLPSRVRLSRTPCAQSNYTIRHKMLSTGCGMV
jgi:hypothetical protein